MHRFEPTGNDLDGFWSISSSIDWCERNYVVSWYIAEFWNTLSSLVIILCGALDLYQSPKMECELRFQLYALSVILVGLGTVAFHGSLTYVGQLGDELPMVWCMMVSWYILITMHNKKYNGNFLAQVLTTYAIVFSLVHTVGAYTVLFQVHFVVLMLVPIFYTYKFIQNYGHHEAVKPLVIYYAAMWIVAGIVWLTDQLCCEKLHSLTIMGINIPNPQLHALWHILTGVCTHIGTVLYSLIRHMVLHNSHPKVEWVLGVWPTLKISKQPCKVKSLEEDKEMDLPDAPPLKAKAS
jgi:dihydroceramidase